MVVPAGKADSVLEASARQTLPAAGKVVLLVVLARAVAVEQKHLMGAAAGGGPPAPGLATGDLHAGRVLGMVGAAGSFPSPHVAAAGAVVASMLAPEVVVVEAEGSSTSPAVAVAPVPTMLAAAAVVGAQVAHEFG